MEDRKEVVEKVRVPTHNSHAHPRRHPRLAPEVGLERHAILLSSPRVRDLGPVGVALVLGCICV